MTTDQSRPPLDRARIVAAGVALADAEGLEAISMRRVADALGYKVMSLYNHIANKDDLLEEMVDAALAEVDPAPAADWRSDVVAVATATKDALTAHGWATLLWPLTFPGPQRWRLAERLLEGLQAGGLPDAAADLGFHLVVNHMVGYAHLASGYAATRISESSGRERFLREVTADRFPAMDAHARFHAADTRAERPDEFRYVLELILDGIASGA